MGYRTNLRNLRIAAPVAAATVLLAGASQAGNIITFGANSNKCGGAVVCSYDGTTGYLNNGMGQPFNLSTIKQWFQIDVGGLNMLANQTVPEPDKGAGSFLVTNDTGSAITSFTLNLNDDFTAKTASVHPCTGAQKGNICDNFTAHGGSGNFTYDTELSGANWDRCTQGTVNGQTCIGNAGGVAADFAPGNTTYTWTAEPGKSIPAGGNFTISFSGWNNDGVQFTPSVCDGISGNLIQNCGFETGDYTDWTLLYGTANISSNSNSGRYAADVPTNLPQLEQSFSSAAGTQYTVSYYLSTSVYGFDFVCVDGASGFPLGCQNVIGHSPSGWTKISFQFTGDGSTDILYIETTSPAGFSGDVLLDDFSVVAQ